MPLPSPKFGDSSSGYVVLLFSVIPSEGFTHGRPLAADAGGRALVG